MTILDIATAKLLKSNIHMHFVTVDGLSHKVICTLLVCGHKKLNKSVAMDLQEFIAQHSPG